MTSARPLQHLLLPSPPHLLILTLLFALPSYPATIISSPSNSSSPLTLLASTPLLAAAAAAGRDLECFSLATPKAHPVTTTDCPPAIDLLYHDPTGVMSLQHFSRDPATKTFQVPFAWQFGACQVLLTSGSPAAVDTFRLADVIVKALRIIDECPPKSKRGLGGLALVGHGESFFVVVNGPDLEPDGEVDVGEGGRGRGR